jgi:hypothetical protein
MTHSLGIGPYFASFSRARLQNIAQSCVPYLNLVLRHLQEKRWDNTAGNAPSLNAQRVAFQNDFLVGTAVKALLAIFLYSKYSGQSARLPGKFALIALGLSVPADLMLHYYEKNRVKPKK